MFAPFRFKVLFYAALGLAIGLVAHHAQSPHLAMVNQWGVMAFVSMGASLGCLLSDPSGRRS